MVIHVNGEEREVMEGTTIRRLLEQMGLDPLRVAVQRNRDIVRRDDFREFILKPGDTVEVLTFMAGG